MTKIRVRYPDRVRYDREHLGLLPISLATATPAAGGHGPRGHRGDRLRPARPARDDPHRPQPQRAVAREPAAGHHRDRRARKPRPGLGQPRPASEAGGAEVPPGYRWELAGQLPGAAGVVRQPADGPDRRRRRWCSCCWASSSSSLTLPILIFLAQPISLASALFALWITGTPLNVSSFMGAILLIGLDVKNGIILIEYIGQLRDEGMPLREALVQAGRTRFRPILMTSLCTIFGLVPLALGMGPGADAAAAGDRRHRRPDHQHAPDPAADPGRLPGPEGTRERRSHRKRWRWSAEGNAMARVLVVEDQKKHLESLQGCVLSLPIRGPASHPITSLTFSIVFIESIRLGVRRRTAPVWVWPLPLDRRSPWRSDSHRECRRPRDPGHAHFARAPVGYRFV